MRPREMPELIDAIDAYAFGMFVALTAFGAVATTVAWHRRAHAECGVPVPMLRKRTALGLLAMASGVFALLAVAVLRDGRLVALDLRVTAAIRDAFGETMLHALAWVTKLGNVDVLTAVAVVIALSLLVTRSFVLAGLWMFTLAGNGLLVRVLKDFVQRTRPLHDHGFAIETGFSFPSGHAAGSLVFYGMSAYLMLVLCRPRWHRAIVAISTLLIAVIGASRVLLQVHYLSDVCAGYAVGLSWLALCIGTGEWLRTARHSVVSPVR